MTNSPADDEAAPSADILKRIEAENIRNVRLVITDLYGVPRGKVVTRRGWSAR